MPKSTRPCYWNGCTVTVPASMLMCRRHWFALPRSLRNRVWSAYEPGQEENLAAITDEYRTVLEEVKRFVQEAEKAKA